MGETIKIREENSIVRPDMINLLLEARKGIAKNEENVGVEAGFATVEEANLGKGILNFNSLKSQFLHLFPRV